MVIDETLLTTSAALFGVDPHSLNSKGGSDGAVYSCRQGSRAGILKLVPLLPGRQSVYEERLAFMLYLAENGVPVAVPQESENGRRYEIVPGEGGPYAVTLTYLAGGRHPTPRNAYDWNDRLFACWGQVMGKMHALARAYPCWQKSTPGEEGQASQIIDWQDEHESFGGWCREPAVVAQWRKLYEPLAALPRERDCFGLIHNDLHMWNFLYQPDTRGQPPITIVDFDVCAYHWFITDIAIAVYHGITFRPHRSLSEREMFARCFLQPFMTGYLQENSLDAAWLARLPLFLRYREILVYIAVSKEWPEEKRTRWQVNFLAEKRARILRGEALILSFA